MNDTFLSQLGLNSNHVNYIFLNIEFGDDYFFLRLFVLKRWRMTLIPNRQGHCGSKQKRSRQSQLGN